MYYIYLIRSKRSGKIYTGYSTDLKRRIREHLHKSNHTTARFGDIKLIYYEAFIEERDAKERETYLKTTKGKRAIKLMLQHTLKN